MATPRRGRPEVPVVTTVPELAELATKLREIRLSEGKGITYVTLAERTPWSKSQLQRATSGKALPSPSLVRAFLSGCGASRGRARIVAGLYRAAAAGVAQQAKTAKASRRVPKPEYVRDRADLSGALRDAWAHAGRPPVRSMAQTAGPWILPHSSAHRILRGHGLPRDLTQYRAFLYACDIPDVDLGPWFAAWNKALSPVSLAA
ncbi:helix-turn-helix transcriptional regulator [Streptomyces sp. NBC_01381]|uniref:helix-turn-helix domain-containing protein n=1 Tax=Streptomyces sp. NBC_01381 TaxID=2903845 RepID=UPI002250A71B|nr:helix-turn-helix transcriptional regulator [Streptomyces sp. NBC_01381]MCX4673541.1 helix-turn-helix transcriptional regulator [Streptomyces sp. NBC_01381]